MRKLAEISKSGQKLYNIVLNQADISTAINSENEESYSEEIPTYKYEPLCNENQIPQAKTPAFGKSLSLVSYVKEEEAKV
jgi:hypothetical protein